MDTSTYSLLITISFNVALLILVLVFFSVIRVVRGDKQKVRLTQKLMEKFKVKVKEHDLLNVNPTNSKYSYHVTILITQF